MTAVLEDKRAGLPGPDHPLPDMPPGRRWPRLRAVARTVAVIVTLLAALAAVAALAAFLSFPQLRSWHHLPSSSWLPSAAAVAALILLVAAWRASARLVRGKRPAALLTVIAAVDASVSASTGMWVFFGNVLNFSVLTRLPIFSFLEIAVITFALRARDNLLDSTRRAADGEDVAVSRGVDGILMWVCTETSAVLSSMASVSLPEVAFRLATPTIAAVLWESGLSAERRRAAGKKRDPRKINWRFSAERILVLIGLADPVARNIDDVAAEHHLTQVAIAVVRARRAKTKPGKAVTMARVRYRMRQAEEHAGLAGDDGLRLKLMAKVNVLSSAPALVDLEARNPWQVLPAAGGGRGGGSGGQRGSRVYDPLADDLASAIPLAVSGDLGAAQAIHQLLSGRSDYTALCQWLAINGGTKRMMTAVALYAVGHIKARTDVITWVAAQVPGDAGKIDRTEVRVIAQALEPVWAAGGVPAVQTGKAGAP